MHSLKDKVAIVTGGANGIGAQIVKQFLEKGAKHVAFIDINESSGSAVENELRKIYEECKTTFFKCDVTKDEELFAVYDKVIQNFGSIDVVVNNAGIACDHPEVYKKEIQVNFTAVVTSTLKALELMRKDKGGKGGTVINISSALALFTKPPGLSIYSATKSAVLHFSNSLGSKEYSDHTHVRILTLCFFGTDTDLLTDILGIDEIATKNIKNTISLLRRQSTEEASKGVVQSYEQGESGSTWVISEGKTSDITDNIKKGFNTMLHESMHV